MREQKARLLNKNIIVCIWLLFLITSCDYGKVKKVPTNNPKHNTNIVEEKQDSVNKSQANNLIKHQIVKNNKSEESDIGLDAHKFVSTFDTTFTDTIDCNNYLVIIESIADSIYNELYNKFQHKTKRIASPKDRFHAHSLERIGLANSNNLAYRINDTLFLLLENDTLTYVNCHNCEVGYSYSYVDYLSQIKCHLLYLIGEGGGLFLVSEKKGLIKEQMSEDFFMYDSVGAIIACEFNGKVLGGMWANYLRIYDSRNGEPVEQILSIQPNKYVQTNKYREPRVTWGFRNPFWLSDNTIIFSYTIGESLKGDRFNFKHCYSKMTLIKKGCS